MLTKSEISKPPLLNWEMPSKCERTIYSQQDFKQAIDFLEKSTNLIHIKLVLQTDDDLVVDSMKLLPILMKMEKLQSLELFNFSNAYFYLVSKVVMEKSSLAHLTIRMNASMDESSVNCLATLIKSNSKLRSISIGAWEEEDDFSVIKPSPIFKALEQNNCLTHVDLSNNLFASCKKAARDIAAMLKKNKNLKSLNLANPLLGSGYQSVQTILAALAENQILVSLDLSANGSIINNAVLSQLAKNTSLTYLHLLNYPTGIIPDSYTQNVWEDWDENLDVDNENEIPDQTFGKIEQLIKRNIDFKLWSLFQKYLLLTNLALPDDLLKLIFSLMIAKIGIEELAALFTTSSFKNGDYLNPPVVEEIKDNKINHFKTIYKALYEGQGSCFKHWNSLVDKEDLSAADIEQYIKENKNSRTAKAWQLADNYEVEQDYKKLFKKAHQYSLANSSNFFGLFKQSHNFSKGYNNFATQIKQAEQGSRTRTIVDIFEASSIKP
jgi:hypothetical protein